jgi:hypothetical protein
LQRCNLDLAPGTRRLRRVALKTGSMRCLGQAPSGSGLFPHWQCRGVVIFLIALFILTDTVNITIFSFFNAGFALALVNTPFELRAVLFNQCVGAGENGCSD